MPYSEFTLKSVKEALNINVVEGREIFSQIEALEISELLMKLMKYNVPLAMAIGTEKARSEMIVGNILIEVKRMLDEKANRKNNFTSVRLSLPLLKQKMIKRLADWGNASLKCMLQTSSTKGNHLPTIYGAVTTGSHCVKNLQGFIRSLI